MKTFLLSLSVALFAVSQIHAQKSAVCVSSGVAISGYDPVAYFNQGAAVRGDKKFAFHWQDADWYFSTAENQKSFSKAPEKYAPQYGGYCAYGASMGHKATTDPQVWTIVDGKLYLNYNGAVRKMWAKDEKVRIGQADANWPKIKDKE
jgi:hypothetical protein